MIFTRQSLQFERALKNLTPNTERATKKQNAFWAGFRKKEESYYFFPDLVILINNEPSLTAFSLQMLFAHWITRNKNMGCSTSPGLLNSTFFAPCPSPTCPLCFMVTEQQMGGGGGLGYDVLPYLQSCAKKHSLGVRNFLSIKCT